MALSSKFDQRAGQAHTCRVLEFWTSAPQARTNRSGQARTNEGYTSFHKTSLEVRTTGGISETTQKDEWDRLLAMTVGFGKHWTFGPGDLRLAIMLAFVGYNFDNRGNHLPLFETYGASLSYQIRPGKKR